MFTNLYYLLYAVGANMLWCVKYDEKLFREAIFLHPKVYPIFGIKFERERFMFSALRLTKPSLV